MSHTVYLSLGSNIAPERHLGRALELLRERFEVFAVSRAYRTAPMDALAQPDFVNMAVGLRTTLAPSALQAAIKALEREAGRQPRSKVEPREIDIDVLTFDARVQEEQEGGLRLPHRSLPRYAYVLAPLCDIAPDWVHPELHVTVAQLLERLDPEHRASVLELGAWFNENTFSHG